MIYDSKHFLYYYRLTPDNRMLFGGRAAFFPETETTVRQSAEILRRGMTGVYPQLRDAKIEFVWAARWISRWTSCRTREKLTACISPRASPATASPPPPGSA